MSCREAEADGAGMHDAKITMALLVINPFACRVAALNPSVLHAYCIYMLTVWDAECFLAAAASLLSSIARLEMTSRLRPLATFCSNLERKSNLCPFAPSSFPCMHAVSSAQSAAPCCISFILSMDTLELHTVALEPIRKPTPRSRLLSGASLCF